MRLPAGVERRVPGSTWARLLLLALVLVLGGVIAGYAVLVASTVNAPPAAQLSSRPSLAAATSRPGASACAATASGSVPASAAAAAGADGPWVVAADGGFVGYRASETLALDFIRSPNEAVGRSRSVAGSLEIDGTTLTAARVEADLRRLTSDIDIRDGHLTEYLHLREQPDATFELTQPIELGAVAPDRVVDVVATGDLTLLETTRSVEIPLQARWNGDSIQVAGSLPIRRSDWGMDVPQLMGFRVSEEVTIELELVFVRPSPDPCGPPPTTAPGGSPGPSPSAAPTTGPVHVAELDAWPRGAGDIAFVAFLGDVFHGDAPGEVFLLRAGASTPRQLTDTSGGIVDDPAWSADGSRLVYARYPYERPPTLWLTGTAGGEGEELSDAALRRPSWSPDGAFLVAIPADELDTRIVRLDVATGATVTLLEGAGAPDGPRWSPDGDRIAFSLQSPGANDEDLYVMAADGSGVMRLTDDPAYEYAPAWSPDGSRIAFIRDGNVWVMRSDGTDARQLTSGLLADAPTWTPDGRRIAFVVTSGGVMTADENRRFLWLVDADGANLSRFELDVFLIARPASRPHGDQG